VIDSFEFVAPLAHIIGPDGPLYAGRVASVNEDGELEWDTPKRCEIKGSHEAKLTARSCLSDDFPGRPCVFVQASVKVFQGHNLFGSDDLAGLCREALVFIVRDRGISPAAADLEDWNRGMIAIKRVDPTFMYDLGTPARVQTAIRSMQDRGRLAAGHSWRMTSSPSFGCTRFRGHFKAATSNGTLPGSCALSHGCGRSSSSAATCIGLRTGGTIPPWSSTPSLWGGSTSQRRT
jgi:hypothetical protein